MDDLLITNIGLLATPTGQKARAGLAQGDITLVKDAAVAAKGGRITYAGPAAGAPKAKQTVDAGGHLVTPGLIDCHTHLVFGGWRQHELAQKLAGVPYIDILKAGGGILSTVKATRAALAQELAAKALKILEEMRGYGVTLCEAKSGYGLTVEDEIKQLSVINKLNADGPVPLVATFLGAHALPPEYKDNRAAYIDLVCEEMIPAVAAEDLAEFCDVFCEVAVFDAEETRRILLAAKQHGMSLKVHADEIQSIGGTEVAAELRATSAEHLICSTPPSIRKMADAGVIGVLLPATSFYLGKDYAPARQMLEAGMALAMASDFNPGSSPGCNLQLAMNIGCLGYRLTPAEALCAVTLNAAAALGRAKTHGSIEKGKRADLLIWDAPDLDYIFYRFGSNLVKTVILGGETKAWQK